MAAPVVILPVKSLADAQRGLEELARRIGAATATIEPVPTLVAGPGISITPSGTGDSLTIAATGTIGGGVYQVVTITTASLADGATETGVVTIARTSFLQRITASVPCWLRLYETASARTDDAGRAITTSPIAGKGLLSNAAPGLDLAGLVLPVTPAHELHNADSPRTSAIYYAVTNESGGTASVALSLMLVVEEP